jgi:hypothetical protein
MNAPIHKELPSHFLNAEAALRDVTQSWDSSILKELTSYIEIPAKSPSFDSNADDFEISQVYSSDDSIRLNNINSSNSSNFK